MHLQTITSELAILQLLNARPAAKTVYVAPLKALARERLADWKQKLGQRLGLTVVELTGDVTPDLALLKRAHVIITTPGEVTHLCVWGKGRGRHSEEHD